MHPAKIQAELKIIGITQKQIAQDLGVSEFHISEVINKKRSSDRVMKHIAGIIDKHPEEIFPEYYFRTNRRARNVT